MKPKGNQKNNVYLTPNISILNGEKQICGDGVPTFFLFYEPDETDKTEQKIKLWMKLENIKLNEMVQINKELKEISIWFKDADVEKIKKFLKIVTFKQTTL